MPDREQDHFAVQCANAFAHLRVDRAQLGHDAVHALLDLVARGVQLPSRLLRQLLELVRRHRLTVHERDRHRPGRGHLELEVARARERAHLLEYLLTLMLERFDRLQPPRIGIQQVAVTPELRSRVRRLLRKRLQSRCMLAEPWVEIGRRADSRCRPRHAILVQRVDRQLSELRETSRMPGCCALGRKLLVLARSRIG